MRGKDFDVYKKKYIGRVDKTTTPKVNEKKTPLTSIPAIRKMNTC